MRFETIKIVSNKSTEGEPDIIVARGASTFVLELLLTSRDDDAHREHILRFKTKGNYKAGDKKCIVTIGTDEADILHKMQVMRTEQIKENDLSDVEIIGVMPSKAFCQYTVYISAPHDHNTRTAQQNFAYDSYYIPVDGVSRSISGLGIPTPVIDVEELVERKKMQSEIQKVVKELTVALDENRKLKAKLRDRRSSNRFVRTGLQLAVRHTLPTAIPLFTDSVVCVCSFDRGHSRDRRRGRSRSRSRSRGRSRHRGRSRSRSRSRGRGRSRSRSSSRRRHRSSSSSSSASGSGSGSGSGRSSSSSSSKW